jgi:hypothetical protein
VSGISYTLSFRAKHELKRSERSCDVNGPCVSRPWHKVSRLRSAFIDADAPASLEMTGAWWCGRDCAS